MYVMLTLTAASNADIAILTVASVASPRVSTHGVWTTHIVNQFAFIDV